MATNPTTTPTTPAATGSLPVVWAIGFLTSIGAPTTQNNIDNVLRWGNAESGGTQTYGGWNNFNPLNIVTQSGDNSTGAGGAQGDIANFGDITSGVAASARLFQGNPNASGIISTLRSNGSTDQLNSAVNQFYSTWGGSINLTGASSAPQTVTTDSWTNGLIGSPVGAFLGSLGITTPLSSLSDTSKVIVGVLSNWRYLVEVFVGGVLILMGVLLIGHDTGATKKAASIGKDAAGAAAVAA